MGEESYDDLKKKVTADLIAMDMPIKNRNALIIHLVDHLRIAYNLGKYIALAELKKEIHSTLSKL